MASLRKTCPRPKGCGRRFTPRRGTRRAYCYECHPERSATSTSPPEVGAAVPLLTNGEMATAVAAELERLGQKASVTGVIALKLARALDDPSLGATQITSVSQRLLATLEPLQKLAPREPDAVDEFTRRLLEKQASA